MSEFLGAATRLPTVLFTIALVLVVVYWLFVILGAFGDEVFGGGDGADGIELGGGNGGPVSRLLDALGITTVPATVVISFLILFSWFLCLVIDGLVDDPARSGLAALAVGAGTTVVALLLALPLTALAARPFRRFYVHTPAQLRGSFVGKLCTVRTGTVSDRFGQAEVADPDGATLLVQVRCMERNDLGSGDAALIYSYDPDDEVFLVARADDALSEG